MKKEKEFHEKQIPFRGGKNRELLTPQFCQIYHVPYDANVNIKWISAQKLLVSNRIDLIAKSCYIWAKSRNIETKFFDNLYEEIIWANTVGTFVEDGQEETKYSFESFCDEFYKIYLSIVEAGGIDPNISVVPIGRDNSILNGAHRTAIAILEGLSVPVAEFPEFYPQNDADFFWKNGVREEYIDYLVLEYLHRIENAYVMILWPNADEERSRQKVDSIIREKSKIIYKKEILLSSQGIRNLCTQMYQFQTWMGSYEDHFPGAMEKAVLVWKKNVSTIFYFIEDISADEVVNLKTEIRELFHLEKESVHSTDTIRETRIVAESVLNQNSLDLLNAGTPDKFSHLYKMHMELKNEIMRSGKALEDYVIDSSAVMGLYGLREPSDLDYLCKEENILLSKMDNIDFHDEYIKYHACTVDDLLYDPSRYLYYNELKYISLKECKLFKVSRGEKKDLEDIKLINVRLDKKLRSKIVRAIILFRRRFRFELRILYGKIVKFSHKVGMYEFCRDLKHKVMRR